MKDIIEYIELLYKSFLIDKKKYFKVPDKITCTKYMSIYVFYLNTLPDTDVISLILN